MYYYIEGTLTHKEAAFAVIDCGGVGYNLIISFMTYSRLPDNGAKVRLYSHLIVKDDALELLGFFDLAEKKAFIMLTSVSGIGPKSAMNVLSVLTADRFAFAVASDDYKEIALAQGVSTKTAQRIILELKDKIKKEDISRSKGMSEHELAEISAPAGHSVRADAINTLLVLGYSRTEAQNALKNADLTKSIEEIIKAALKNLI